MSSYHFPPGMTREELDRQIEGGRGASGWALGGFAAFGLAALIFGSHIVAGIMLAVVLLLAVGQPMQDRARIRAFEKWQREKDPLD